MMEELLKRVAEARAKELAARNELIEAMQEAANAGATLRLIGQVAGYSHTHVSNLIRRRKGVLRRS